jgi:hypothetical protein
VSAEAPVPTHQRSRVMSEITIDLHNRRLDLLGRANSSGCTASAYARAAPDEAARRDERTAQQALVPRRDRPFQPPEGTHEVNVPRRRELSAGAPPKALRGVGAWVRNTRGGFRPGPSKPRSCACPVFFCVCAPGARWRPLPADGCRQALDLLPPAVGEEHERGAQQRGHPDVDGVPKPSAWLARWSS